MRWNFAEDDNYLKLPPQLYRLEHPTAAPAPKLALFNQTLADQLDLGSYVDPSDLSILAGNSTPSGSTPIAQAYAGHQFGHFNMLGDGRALLLGEHLTRSGQRFDLQLKGSGPTAFSRRGDGRAALGPMLREYLISEAMYYLGIPTTRSLAVVSTGQTVYRENPLPGAVLTRVAASHIRVGTFEYAAYLRTEEAGPLADGSALKKLADYTMARHYPELLDAKMPYLKFISAVCERQADLIAKWMLVGFIHGVMNTDNMAISGETIDYGPCAFMDHYNPGQVYSSIDRRGRYAYGNQPSIAMWNLTRFAETLLPLIADQMGGNHETALAMAQELAQEALQTFQTRFQEKWELGLVQKIGFTRTSDQSLDLAQELLEIMKKNKADFTTTFRSLTQQSPHLDEFSIWRQNWKRALGNESEAEIFQRMNQINPAFIPRNHLVEEALAAAAPELEAPETDAPGAASSAAMDLSKIQRLLEALRTPFTEVPGTEDLRAPPTPEQIVRATFCGT